MTPRDTKSLSDTLLQRFKLTIQGLTAYTLTSRLAHFKYPWLHFSGEGLCQSWMTKNLYCCIMGTDCTVFFFFLLTQPTLSVLHLTVTVVGACFLLHMLGIHEQSLFICHRFADLTAQLDSLIETKSPILNNLVSLCWCRAHACFGCIDKNYSMRCCPWFRAG